MLFVSQEKLFVISTHPSHILFFSFILSGEEKNKDKPAINDKEDKDKPAIDKWKVGVPVYLVGEVVCFYLPLLHLVVLFSPFRKGKGQASAKIRRMNQPEKWMGKQHDLGLRISARMALIVA